MIKTIKLACRLNPIIRDYRTGFALKEFAKPAGVELRPGDVSQED